MLIKNTFMEVSFRIFICIMYNPMYIICQETLLEDFLGIFIKKTYFEVSFRLFPIVWNCIGVIFVPHRRLFRNTFKEVMY